ncbi:MAG: bifunctional aspartate kinase/diaminopimelate decarboxylase, partial [Myxococcaceae bacterium]
MTQFVILKFGGTSVATRKSWGNIGQIAQRSLIEGLKPIIVCSAITGVSNLLENIVVNIKQGKDFRPLFDAFKKIHQDLAQELGLDYNLILNPDILQLERVLTGTSLIQEVSPKIQACIMAFGELLSTRLGAAFLVQENISTAWVDARSCLTSTQSNYLSAHCSFESDPELIHRFVSIAESVILTQGFIAKDPAGHTVLLGRGGSDTSAAYFAAKLGAKRCEIWTDVAGMYTANPREVSDARLLKQLDYDEAQEIATMGAKVLHPRCLLPVKQHQIPMYVRSTLEPEHLGTVISQGSLDETPCVKSISTKSNVTLLSIESLGMWQEVGFLADLFACFKQNGISIDLVSTSETNVTVSIDNPSSLDQLIQSIEEKELGTVTIVESCAVVSLVGHRIRSILHQLGPALEVFEEQKVYLVSQAASDLNLTFVVEEQARLTLVQKLHHLLFKGTEEKNKLWWHDEQERLLELSKTNSPLYVYDSETLTQSAKQLLALKSIDRVFYALKANDHQEILKTFFKLGLGFECVSMGEITRVFELFPDIDPKRILFTPNFAPKHEYAFALSKKCQVTLDSVFPLEQWPELLTNQEIFLRLDPGEGKGHHQHVKTAGQQSKFGISIHEIEQVRHLVKQHHVRVVGLQAHAGSGIMDPE